ncbi:hypothetical protein CJP46_11970 [Paenibacillus sp. XY044]|nr:hypothetical protein CJP46_11970 [Paenibacillus sp. XY044]
MAITIYPYNGGTPADPTIVRWRFIDEFEMIDNTASHHPAALWKVTSLLLFLIETFMMYEIVNYIMASICFCQPWFFQKVEA